MRQRVKKPTLTVKKETLRRLEERSISVQDLRQVIGGCWVQPRYSQYCG